MSQVHHVLQREGQGLLASPFVHSRAEARKNCVTFPAELGGYCSLNNVSYGYTSQEKPPQRLSSLGAWGCPDTPLFSS